MRCWSSVVLLSAWCGLARALVCAPARPAAVRRVPPVRMDFGDSFYEGFDKWAAEYPQEDRDTYPELFKLPQNCYEVCVLAPTDTQPPTLGHDDHPLATGDS